MGDNGHGDAIRMHHGCTQPWIHLDPFFWIGGADHERVSIRTPRPSPPLTLDSPGPIVRALIRLPPASCTALAVYLAIVAIDRAHAEESPAPSPIAVADSANDLAPTASVPWNPSHAVPNHETWEQVLNAPLTVVSLPIRALEALAETGLLTVQEEHYVPRVHYGLRATARSGIVVGVGGIEDGSGLGGAIRYAPPPLRGWVRGSLAGTFRHYHRGVVEVGPRWLSASYIHDWRPEEAFFGLGMDVDEDDASDFAMQAERIGLRLARNAGTKWRREVEAWVGERRSVLRPGKSSDRPSVEEVFPITAVGLDVPQVHYLSGARVAIDTRAGRPHWGSGFRLEAQAEDFASVDGDGVVFDGQGSSPGFRRFTLSAQAGWSFMRDPRTVRLIGRVVDIEPRDASRPPALNDLSRLGGAAGLGAFEPGRFHDLDLVVMKLAYIFPVLEYAEIEVATDVGGVFSDVWSVSRIDQLEQTYSVILRPRSHRAPLGAIGVSWGREGARMRLSLGGVE